MEKQAKLQSILDKAISAKVFGNSFCVEYKDQIWCGASGNLTPESQYFIASTTKLFVTAIILQFRSRGMLKLSDPISMYLDKQIMNGLHTLKGVDYAAQITIQQLLAHTSGIPDYFGQKDAQGVSLEDEILSGTDKSWSFQEAVELSKTLEPLFVPGTPGKAHYSDTNFQLLGKIIEILSDNSFAATVATMITQPLGLTSTYLYQDASDTKPQNMYYKDEKLIIPKAMTSFGPDGGMVSTSRELLAFIKAFFTGKLFPQTYIRELQQWNAIFFPMQAGIGIHRFKLPWIMNPFGTLPELIGHSGLSGALAYCNPEKELYIAGTVNQIAYPDSSFRLAVALIQQTINNN